MHTKFKIACQFGAILTVISIGLSTMQIVANKLENQMFDMIVKGLSLVSLLAYSGLFVASCLFGFTSDAKSCREKGHFGGKVIFAYAIAQTVLMCLFIGYFLLSKYCTTDEEKEDGQ